MIYLKEVAFHYMMMLRNMPVVPLEFWVVAFGSDNFFLQILCLMAL